MGEARMRRILFVGCQLLAVSSALSLSGCLQHEMMTQQEVFKYNPRPDEFVHQDESIVKPRPETCLNAGKMYESLYKSSEDPLQKRDFAWRAKKAYQQAEQLAPHSAVALAGLARIDELEGNPMGASQHYSQCLQYTTGKPGDAGIVFEAGMFYARQKQFDQALQMMVRAMQLEPGNRSYAMNYGFTLARAGRFEESYRHFLQITTPVDAGYQVALMAKHVGNIEVARQYGMLAVQANPQNSAEAQAFLTALDQPAPTQVQQSQFGAQEQLAQPGQ